MENSVDSDKTWPKLVHDTVPVTPVVPSKKAENVQISGIYLERSFLRSFLLCLTNSAEIINIVSKFPDKMSSGHD